MLRHLLAGSKTFEGVVETWWSRSGAKHTKISGKEKVDGFNYGRSRSTIDCVRRVDLHLGLGPGGGEKRQTSGEGEERAGEEEEKRRGDRNGFGARGRKIS